MSGAIWGQVRFDNDTFDKSVQDMGKFFFDMPFDYSNQVEIENVIMGCTSIHIREECKYEKQPLNDTEKDIIIVADAMIDNRDELIVLLGLDKVNNMKYSDSDLILEAFNKWRTQAPEYLIGDFACVIYDKSNKEIFCFRDHTGSRTLYYYLDDKMFAFATFVEPLLNMDSINRTLNEEWISEFLAIPGVVHELGCEKTVYKNIYQILPSSMYHIKDKIVRYDNYWNPLEKNTKPIVMSDEAYIEQFTKVFREAVKCRVNSNSDVGIMMSGGLDSSSVAYFAANILKERNRKLYTFTSKPFSGFVDYTGKHRIADETSTVKMIAEKIGNIESSFLSSEKENSVTRLADYLTIFEQPFKTLENTFWYNNIIEKAKRANCKVILNGQFGNSTISRGDFVSNILTLFRKKKWFRIIKEIAGIKKTQDVSYKHVIKIVIHVIKSSIKSEPDDSFSKIMKVSPLSKEKFEKWNIKQKFYKNNVFMENTKYYDFYEINKMLLKPMGLNQIGMSETKFGLRNGVILRDPTKDKRVIEFCLQIPFEQYVTNGIERKLIKRTMKGKLPNSILKEHKKRGIQSADWIQRLNGEWNNIFNLLQQRLKEKEISEYFDSNRLISTIEDLKTNGITYKKSTELRMILVSFVMTEFLLKNERITKK